MSSGINIVTADAAETRALGEALGRLTHAGDIILLAGPLGAGKTCFVQGIARGLGIDDLVSSPTFMLAREYRGERLPLYHIDLYRIEFQEITELGLDEYLYGRGVSAVEWAEKDPDLTGGDHLLIELAYAGEDTRNVRLKPCGARYNELVQAIIRGLDTENET